MITPTAKSTTLPLNANSLNSSTNDHVCRVGTTDAICWIGLLDTTRFRSFIMGCLSLRGSEDAPVLCLEGAASCGRRLVKDKRLHADAADWPDSLAWHAGSV